MTIKEMLDKLASRGIETKIETQENLTISLWHVNQTTDRSPILKGYVTLNGTRYPIVLWNNQSENARAPQFVGGLNKLSTIGVVTQA